MDYAQVEFSVWNEFKVKGKRYTSSEHSIVEVWRAGILWLYAQYAQFVLADSDLLSFTQPGKMAQNLIGDTLYLSKLQVKDITSLIQTNI